MPFPDNTPGIDELINLPVGEIALLPVDLLAAMQREIDAGFFLPCCSRPLSDLVIAR